MYPYLRVSTLLLENLLFCGSTLDFLGWEVVGVAWSRFLGGFALERFWLGAEFGFGFGIGVFGSEGSIFSTLDWDKLMKEIDGQINFWKI
jgi:hypothetical protein